jgi:hypothetical protein
MNFFQTTRYAEPDAMAGRSAALAIIVATIATLILVAHHPVVGPGGTPQESLSSIVALGQIDAVVHGMLIAMVGLFAYGFAVFGVRLGLQRGPALLATLAYLLGCISVVGAALLDGFVIPDIAARFSTSTDSQIQVAHGILASCGIAVQVLTKFGFSLMSVGFIAWSLALWGSSKRIRWLVTVALAAGVLPATVIAASGLSLKPHTLMVIVAGQAFWNFIAAKLLWSKGML